MFVSVSVAFCSLQLIIVQLMFNLINAYAAGFKLLDEASFHVCIMKNMNTTVRTCMSFLRWCLLTCSVPAFGTEQCCSVLSEHVGFFNQTNEVNTLFSKKRNCPEL